MTPSEQRALDTERLISWLLIVLIAALTITLVCPKCSISIKTTTPETSKQEPEER